MKFVPARGLSMVLQVIRCLLNFIFVNKFLFIGILVGHVLQTAMGGLSSCLQATSGQRSRPKSNSHPGTKQICLAARCLFP